MYISKSRTALTVLTVIIVASFLFSSLFSYFSTKNSLTREIQHSSLPLLSENIYSDMQRSLSVPLNVSSAISRDAFLINWIKNGETDLEQITQYLSNIQERYGFYTTFFVSDITKNYYYNEGILKTISPEDSHDIWYELFLESGKEADLDVDTNEAEQGVLTIFINYRLEDFDGTLLGVAGVGIKLDHVAQSLREKQKKYNRMVYLVDENAVVQVHTDPSIIEKSSLYEEEGIREIASDLMARSMEPIDRVYKKDNQSIFVSSRYIPELGWHVIVEQEAKESYYDARKSLYLSLLLIIFVTVLLFYVSYRILKGFEKYMELQAGTDSLTKAVNRRELEKQFAISCYRIKRYNFPLSLIVIDLDNFKTINDEYGHLKGDLVLIEISRVIRNTIRPDDLLARWGGDEFVILLESGTEEASIMAHRIQQACLKVSSLPELQISQDITVSIGISGFLEGDTMESLISRADSAMYSSKKNGRNRITLAKDA